MKTLYLECNMGCSGDMLMSALLDLLPDSHRWVTQFQQIGIPRVQLNASKLEKCGIYGTHVSVCIDDSISELEHTEHHHNHDHHNLGQITNLIGMLSLPDPVKEQALAVYRLLAQAESQVHQTTMEQIHFHEVGSLDAVADIVGVCLLLHELQPDQILASPVVTGSGTVSCAHGLLPVPAPATTLLLRGIPWRSGTVESELCTPTGAALLQHFVQSFGPMPLLTVDQVGIGTGQKDFPQANILRAFWSDSSLHPTTAPDQIVELRCTLDDMTGEELSFAIQQLWDAHPLDLYTQSVQMKKNRPGTVLCVTCTAADADGIAQLMLRYTTTAGVRKHIEDRYVLNVRFSQKETPYGLIRIKHYSGFGVQKSKPEFQDLVQAAKKHGVSIDTVQRCL